MKSDVSDYLELVEALYHDCFGESSADVSAFRDLKTCRSRIEHEGLSFLTITLPNFCKGVETALELGFIDSSWRSTIFRGFPFRKAGPAFLSGVLSLLFDYETGRLNDEENSIALRGVAPIVFSVRQFCLAFKKMELGCSAFRVSAAFSNYVEIEHALSVSLASTDTDDEFLSVSRVLWDDLCYHLRDCEFVPRHGPGATAEGISGNGKFIWQYWYERLDVFFPFGGNAISLQHLTEGGAEKVAFVKPESESPVKVIQVPKTLKAPRIIAIEPVCMQYAQQGIRSVLYDAIESYWITQDHINFRDQSINQTLAMKSSIDRRLATIDLSDASDRVPLTLALRMFDNHPFLKGAIEACRSTHAKLPDGRIIGPLVKFASMGSALCFPIEAMYFYTICVAALLEFHNLPVSQRNIYFVSRDLYVYGDDIVVPTDAAETVLRYLHKYHCKPNTSKTFVKGNFRESCGVDAFAGELVTPVYIRKVRPRDRHQGPEVVSWSATANLAFERGLYRVAELMHTACEDILGFYPEVSRECAGLGRIYRISGKRRRFKRRFNPDLQRIETLSFVPSTVYRNDALYGYDALNKSLLKLESSPDDAKQTLEMWSKGITIPDDSHLERSARRGVVALKLRWVAAT